MAKLWSKKNTKTHPIVEVYTAGTDHLFDAYLLPFDIEATRAHVRGLQKIGILTAKELKSIESTLTSLKKEFAAGTVVITPADEDCHTVIENYLVEKLGDVGKKVHTGRSRNDQVLVATRLYMKEHLTQVRAEALALAKEFLAAAEKYQKVPMPGYSHTQQAMLSSVSHYFANFTESLLDDAEYLAQTIAHLDKNPLGSAAGFGVSLPLDRAHTTRELGFKEVQINSLYCQNSRGKFESAYMEALAQVMLTLGKFATDMVLFTSQEFGYFSVEESLTTGSSIMPQKRNLDPMELLRGNVSVVIGNQLMVKDIAKNLLSGYNRDLQLIKKPLVECTDIVHTSIAVASAVLKGSTPKEAVLRAKISKEIFAADIANDLVQKEGLPFRDAYGRAMDALATYTPDMEKNIASKVSMGAPGNLQLKKYKDRLARAAK